MDKIDLFLSGRWTAPEPSVSTMFWSVRSWIEWIDERGQWQA